MKLKKFLAQLPSDKRQRFCELAGTTYNHLLFQVLGGHRGCSPRLRGALVCASRAIYPNCPSRWLTLGNLHEELMELKEQRSAARADV